MILVVIVALLLFFPLTRMILANLHNIGIYSIYDLYCYVRYKRWKIWNGYGLNIYVGMFGKGKTLSATHYVISQAKQYNLHVLSNIKLNGIEYEALVNWQQIVNSPPNTIILIDEISTVFNARQWKDFNINLLFQILQCRKNKKMLVGTAQRFAHVDKLLRDVTNYVIDCNKLWRFQRNTYYDAWDYENCMNFNMLKSIKVGWYFVKNSWFNAYDTSEIIDNVKRTDFCSNEEILVSRGNTESDVMKVGKYSRKGKKRIKL